MEQAILIIYLMPAVAGIIVGLGISINHQDTSTLWKWIGGSVFWPIIIGVKILNGACDAFIDAAKNSS